MFPKFLPLFIIVGFLIPFFNYTPTTFAAPEKVDYSVGNFEPGEVIVKFKNETSKNEVLGKIQKNSGFKTSNIDSKNRAKDYEVLRLENSDKIAVADINTLKKETINLIKELKSNSGVEYAFANYILKNQAVPNDAQFVNQWGLNNTGQSGGTSDMDINYPEALDVTDGGTANIKIAVIDTGAQLNHPDLDTNIIAGYDFVNNDSLPNDDDGHGTHVSGIVAAKTNNTIGVAGTCPKCKIMPLKALDGNGSGNLDDIASSIDYAVANGARVINMSLGGVIGDNSAINFFQQKVDNAIANQAIVVAAAGNCGASNFASQGCNFQNQTVYPGALNNVIAVASINRNGNKSSFSNVGSYVDISAPGESIRSTCTGGTYCDNSGTSMAAPYVAGGVALILSKEPTLNYYSINSLLQTTTKVLGSPGYNTQTGYGLFNLRAALDQSDQKCTIVPTGEYCTEIYNNKNLSGNPTVRVANSGTTIEKNFGSGGPGYALANDNFSYRFIGKFNFLADTYVFDTTADDGVRVFVDNMTIPVIDKWQDQGPTQYKFNTPLTAGEHTIKVEFYENGGGALLKFAINKLFTKSALIDQNEMKGDLTNLIAGDFNGDGEEDFIRQEKSDWDNDSFNTANLYMNNGSGSFVKSPLINQDDMKGDLTNLMVGDFNGDGKDDFIRQEKGAWASDNFNTANLFISTITTINSTSGANFTKSDLINQNDMKGDQTNLIVGDFNGDSKDDFIRQEKNDWDNDNFNTANLFMSTITTINSTSGANFTKSDLVDQNEMKGDLTNLIVGDFNGDSKDDFIRQEKGSWDDDSFNTANLYSSTITTINSTSGVNFTKTALINQDDMKGDLTNLIAGDFNGDSKDDFIRQEKGSWDDDNFNTANLYTNNGSGSFVKSDLIDQNDMKGDQTNLIVGDFNGDSKDDFIRQEKNDWDNDSFNTANLFIA